MPAHQSLAVARDVNQLIDDFGAAVLVSGQPCSFKTLSVLWQQRSFSAVHWASDSLSKCLVGAPTLKTQQTLFHCALNRTICASHDSCSHTEALHPPPTAAAVIPEVLPPQSNNVSQRTCDLSSQHSHPLIPSARRQHWQKQAAENRRKRAAQQQERRVQEATRLGSSRSASTLTVPETQIAAVFALYALFYTQPSKPFSHIYVSPTHRASLKQTTLMMKERGVHEGVMMLRALATDNAFVWGLIDIATEDSNPPKHTASPPFLRGPSLTTTVTDHSLRAANLHLQQFVPPKGASMKELDGYTAAVADVFSGAPPGSVPGTLAANAAAQLTEKYSAAVRRIREALLEKGGSKHKGQSGNAALSAELDAEIDEELQAAADQERARIRSLGLRLAVVGPPEEEAAVQDAGDVRGGVEKALQATALREKQRQLLSKQWIKFAHDAQAGRPH